MLKFKPLYFCFPICRQSLIDKFNGDPDIYVFLLSTKAGVSLECVYPRVTYKRSLGCGPTTYEQLIYGP